MEKNFSLKRFFLRYLFYLILLLSLFVLGCGDSDSGGSSPGDDGGDTVVTSEVSGTVIAGDENSEASVSMYDSDGDAVVFVDSDAEKQALAETTKITTSSGSFTFSFKKDAYSFPFLLVAEKGDSVYLSISDADNSKMNISSFSTSLIIDMVGEMDTYRQLTSGPGDYIKASSPTWLNFSFFESKAKESFTDDEVKALLSGTKTEYNALSDKISSIVKKVNLFADKNLKTADISGIVRSLQSKEELSGVKVSSALTFSSTITDENGFFVLNDVPASEEIPLNFNKKGFTSNLELFSIDSNASDEERTSAVETYLKPVTTSETKTVAELRQALSESADSSIPVKIAAKDNSIKIKFNLTGRQLLESRGILADDSETITFEMTSVDPTSEREVFPGDFSAQDSDRTTQEDTDEDLTLESVVLADMSMYSSAGSELQPKDLDLDSVLVEMKIPENLQVQYKEAFENGTKTIPCWSFNEETGKWERDGDAELFQIDGVMYGRAKASHFSWWNIDWPIETHAVICGYVTGGENSPVAGAQVVATGVDYQGNSYTTTDKDGFYQLKVKKDSQVKLSASYGDITAKYTDPDTSSEIITVNWDKNTYCAADEIAECCSIDQDWRKDISLKILKVSGVVKDTEGNFLKGALVKSSSGAFAYTDETGKYSLKTASNTTIDLKASYITNDVKASAEKTGVSIGDSNKENQDFTLDITPLKISGKVYYQDSSGAKSAMSDVGVTGSNNQFTTTDENGEYTLYADKDASSLNITYTAFMPSGIYAEQKSYVTFDGSKEYSVDDIVFIEKEAFIKGKVVDSFGSALQGIEVQSNFGKVALTDINGEFKIRVPVDSTAYATAYYSNFQLNMNLKEKSAVVNIPEDGGTFSVGEIALDIRPSYIKGKVTVKESTTVLPGVKVFTEFGGSAVTDENGEYRLKAPVNVKGMKVFFSYESFNEEGLRTRWADPLEKTIDTGLSGQEVELNAELTLESYPPVINSVSASPSSAAPGDTITLKAVASDPDGDTLTIKWFKDSTEIGTGTSVTHNIPSDAETGVYLFKVVVTDGKKSVSRVVEVFVQENRSPVIYDSWTSPFTGAPESKMTAIVKAYDLDGDTLSYSWAWKSGSDLSGVDVSGFNSNEISFNIPSDASAKTYVLTVSVSDGLKSVSTDISFDVVVNRAPEIIGVSAYPAEIKTGESSTLSVSAVDPDGDTLFYDWKYNGSSVSTQQTYEWTSPSGVTEETLYEFVVTVSDGNDHSVSQSVFIKVIPEDSTVPEIKGRVSGFIKDESGDGISGAVVRIYSAHDSGESLNMYDDTDATGYYEFNDIPTGDYNVVVDRDGFQSKAELIRVVN